MAGNSFCVSAAIWLGVGTCFMGGVPTGFEEGIGDVNRAVETARETDAGSGAGDVPGLVSRGLDPGTGRGFEFGDSSLLSDILEKSR
jgi:hypothetical protein